MEVRKLWWSVALLLASTGALQAKCACKCKTDSDCNTKAGYKCGKVSKGFLKFEKCCSKSLAQKMADKVVSLETGGASSVSPCKLTEPSVTKAAPTTPAPKEPLADIDASKTAQKSTT